MADTEYGQLLKISQSGGLNPVQQTRLNELKSSGQTATSTDGGGGGDFASNVAQTLKLYQEANKPVVESLQASIPTIGQQFAQTGQYLKGKMSDLKTYYDDLLSSITGSTSRQVGAVKTNTSQELGRRGISAESGLFGQTINQAVQPVEQAGQEQANQLGFTSKSVIGDLLNQIAQLPISQTQAEQAVQQAIASLQAGGNKDAITGALNLTQNQQTNNLRQQEVDNTKLAQSITANKPTPLDTQIVGNKLVNMQTGQVIANFPSTTGGTGDYYNDRSNKSDSSYTSYVDDIVRRFGMQAAIDNKLVGPAVYAK